jgi:hypothetical protein
MKYLCSLAALAAILSFSGTEARAHHSFAAEYDGKAPVTIKGKLNKVDWVNPHSWISVDVTDAKGKVTTWRCETPPPNILTRRGWKKSMFKQGTEVTVEGWRAKDKSPTMAADKVVIGGQQMFVGNTGNGAPTRQAAPTTK